MATLPLPGNPLFASKAQRIPARQAWTDLRRRLEREGAPLRNLTLSNPTKAGLPYPREEMGRALVAGLSQSYQPEARGSAPARAAVARLWKERGATVGADEIMITASTSEAYAYLFKLLCNPGDNVLVPTPSYPLFSEIARYEGVELRTFPLGYDGAWHLDLDAVAQARTPKTRALLLVSPNNPTGSYVTQAEFDRAFELALPVISDEVFGDYALSRPQPSALCAYDPKRHAAPLFVLDGLSKFAGLPQLKAAWLAVCAGVEQREQALAQLELIADTYLSVGSLVDQALPSLLELSAPTRSAIQARIRANWQKLQECSKGTALTAMAPEGGWTVPVRLPHLAPEDEWSTALLSRGVIVQPGWLYDFPLEPTVILSLLVPTFEFAAGLQTMVDLVDEAVSVGHVPRT